MAQMKRDALQLLGEKARRPAIAPDSQLRFDRALDTHVDGVPADRRRHAESAALRLRGAHAHARAVPPTSGRRAGRRGAARSALRPGTSGPRARSRGVRRRAARRASVRQPSHARSARPRALRRRSHRSRGSRIASCWRSPSGRRSTTSQDIQARVASLRRNGFRIAIDDLGQATRGSRASPP